MKPYSISSLKLTLGGLCLAFLPHMGFAQAAQPITLEPYVALPLTPRLTGIGFVGDTGMVWGDGMLPLVGNRNQVWYVDVQGKTVFDGDWLGSLGTGVRGIYHDSSIFGAYVFVDRNNSPENNTFWFVSPGVEALSQWLDFRANGYFPTNSKKQYGTTDWADNFGIYDYVSFSGHQQYDILMNQDEEVGWGMDAEVGSQVPGLYGMRAYVGGYHFNFQDASDINGVAGRIEIPVNRYLSFTARDSYDNVQYNTFLVGLKVTLGGVNAHPRDTHQAIQERLLDPIERNLATLGQGVGEPIQNVLAPVPAPASDFVPPSVERDNIWFFAPTGTDTFTGSIADCSADNVCMNSNFTQATIEGINDLAATSPDINLNRLFASPSFYLTGVYNSFTGNDPLFFRNDWLWGWNADFTRPEQLALLNGAVVFEGTNNGLNRISLQSNGSQDLGIELLAGSSLTIENSTIGSMVPGLNYHTAIQLQDATLKISDSSQIIAYGNDNRPVTGIDASYTSNLANYSLQIKDSKLQAQSDWLTSNFPDGTLPNQNVISLTAVNAPQVLLDNADVSAIANVKADLAMGGSNLATGFYTNSSRDVKILNTSFINAQASVAGTNQGINLASGIGANAFSEAVSFENNVVVINNSTVQAEASITEANSSGINAAVGIGENIIGVSLTSPELSVEPVPGFTGNNFSIENKSLIQSTAKMTENNSGMGANNLAVGIGENSVDIALIQISQNTFNINDSKVISLAAVGQDNNMAMNFAAGIGANASGDNADISVVNANAFLLENKSEVTATASVGHDNASNNMATGFGSNTSNGDATFDSTVISLTESQLKGKAVIKNDNVGAINLASGLGSNTFGGEVNFTKNKILVSQSIDGIVGMAEIDRDNSHVDNQAVGLGANTIAINADVNFTGNSILLNGSGIKGIAEVGRDNYDINLATGLGANTSDKAINFINNTITLTASNVNGTAEVMRDNLEGTNQGTGLGGNTVAPQSSLNFTKNKIKIEELSEVSGVTKIDRDNNDRNMTTGLGSNMNGGVANFTENTITVTNSTVKATATVENNYTSSYASGLGGNVFAGAINFADNIINFSAQSTLAATATILGMPNANSRARGLNLESPSNDVITINDSMVIATASAIGSFEATGLYATSAIVDMNGGSITTSPISGACTFGTNITLNVTTNPVDTMNCTIYVHESR